MHFCHYKSAFAPPEQNCIRLLSRGRNMNLSIGRNNIVIEGSIAQSVSRQVTIGPKSFFRSHLNFYATCWFDLGRQPLGLGFYATLISQVIFQSLSKLHFSITKNLSSKTVNSLIKLPDSNTYANISNLTQCSKIQKNI